MLILSSHDVEALLTMEDALTAVEEGFRQLALGKVAMPQRNATTVAPHNGLHLAMPAYVGGDVDALTVKIVTVYGENLPKYNLPTIQGVLLVHDARTGQVLALLDAEHLTATRTGAASGVATKYLARADAATVTLFGAGALGPGQLAAVCAVRPVKRVYLITRSGDKDAVFCAQMSEQLAVEVTATRNTQHAIEHSDIICTATNSPTPLFDGHWLKPGTHINAVGAYTSKMRELDTATIQRSRVFVDHHEAARAEAGDLCIPIANGDLTYDHVAGELGAVIAGALPGRTGDDEITLFKSVGLALQDAVTAKGIYLAALAQKIGTEVAL